MKADNSPNLYGQGNRPRIELTRLYSRLEIPVKPPSTKAVRIRYNRPVALSPIQIRKAPCLTNRPIQNRPRRGRRPRKRRGRARMGSADQMPPGGADDRAYLYATLQKIGHESFTRDEVGQPAGRPGPRVRRRAGIEDDDAAYWCASPAGSTAARRASRPQLVGEMSQATSLGQQVWAEARAQNDFAAFLPHWSEFSTSSARSPPASPTRNRPTMR